MRKTFLILLFAVSGSYTQTNLIGNPSFETHTGTAPGASEMWANNYVKCWEMVVRTPDIFPDPITGSNPYPLPAYDGNYFACFGIFDGNGCIPSLESFKTTVDIKKNNGYRLSFWMFSTQTLPTYPVNVYAELHNNIQAVPLSYCTWTSTGSQRILLEVVTYTHPSQFGWSKVETYFTADDDYSELFFYGDRSYEYNPMVGIAIDLVELYDVCDENWITNFAILNKPEFYGGYISLGGPSSYILNDANSTSEMMAGEYIDFLPNCTIITPQSGHFVSAEIVECDPWDSHRLCGTDPPIAKLEMNNNIFNSLSAEQIHKVNSTEKFELTLQQGILISCGILTTVEGKIVQVYSNCNSIVINKNDLAAGLYVLNLLYTNGETESFKIFQGIR